MSVVLRTLVLLLASMNPQEESDVAPSRLGCDPTNRESGDCHSTVECTCDPKAGLRWLGRSNLDDGRVKTVKYYDPGTFIEYWTKFGADSSSDYLNSESCDHYAANGLDDVEFQEQRVWREFWTPPDTLFIDEHAIGDSDAYDRMALTLMWRLARQMHFVFDVRVQKRERLPYYYALGKKGSFERLYFQLLYGFDWYVEGPGSRVEYHVMFSNMPKLMCHDGGALGTTQDWTRPHTGFAGEFETCEGHHVIPWTQTTQFKVIEAHGKNREPKTCDACKTPYTAHAKSEYFAQWDLSVGTASAETAPKGSEPSIELSVDWDAALEELLKAALKGMLKEAPGGEVVLEIGETIADLVEVKLDSGGESGKSDTLAVLATAVTHTDIDGSGSNAYFTLKPVASPERPTAKSAAKEIEGTDMPQNGIHWTVPENQTDNASLPMTGEYVRWETPMRDSGFWNSAQIADVLAVAPDIQNSGRTYGVGHFYLSSIPCLDVVHECACSAADIPPEVRRDPKIRSVDSKTLDRIKGLSEDYFGAADIVVPVEGDEPVVIELAGAEDAFGWSDGIAVVKDDAAVVAEDGRLRVDPRAGGVIIGSEPELGRIFNIEFDRTAKPIRRTWLRDPSDATGADKPVRLATSAAPDGASYHTALLAFEVEDASREPFTLRHKDAGDIATFTPAVRVLQGDRRTSIGRFTGITPEARAALESSSPEELSLVDAKGATTSLADVTGSVKTGRVAPDLILPKRTVKPGEEFDVQVVGDKALASSVSNPPAGAIRIDVQHEGTIVYSTPAEQGTFTMTAPDSGVVHLSARYAADAAKMPQAVRDAETAVNDIERTAPADVGDYWRRAKDGRDALYRIERP